MRLPSYALHVKREVSCLSGLQDWGGVGVVLEDTIEGGVAGSDEDSG